MMILSLSLGLGPQRYMHNVECAEALTDLRYCPQRRRTSHTARRTGAGRRHPAGTTPAHAGRTNNTAASYPTTYQTRNPVAIPGQQQFEAPRHFECASFKEYQVTPAEAPNPAWHPDINAASTLAPLASGPVSHQHPFNRQNGWGTPVFAASAQLGPQESYGISNSHGYGSSHPGYWPPENLAMQPPGTQAYQAPSYGQRFDHAMYQSSEPQSNSYAQMQQSSVPMQGCQPPNPHFDHGIMNKPPVHLTP
jgi:hypothetical protein